MGLSSTLLTVGTIGASFHPAGRPISDVLFAYQAGKEAKTRGEDPVTAAMWQYTQQTMFYEPANEALAAVASAGLSKLGMGETASNIVGGLTAGLAIQGGQLAASAYVNYARNTAKQMSHAYNMRGKFGSGYHIEGQGEATMRRKALNMIRQTGQQINSAFGNEARNYYIGR